MTFRPDGARRVQVDLGGISRTKQSFRDSTDVNLIVKNHTEGGWLSNLNPRQPMYGDFSGPTDLLDAYETVKAAEDDFATLPAAVRTACDESPVKLLQMLAVKEDAQLLVDAGLPVEGLEPTPEPEPAEPAPAAPSSPEPAE